MKYSYIATVVESDKDYEAWISQCGLCCAEVFDEEYNGEVVRVAVAQKKMFEVGDIFEMNDECTPERSNRVILTSFDEVNNRYELTYKFKDAETGRSYNYSHMNHPYGRLCELEYLGNSYEDAIGND